MKKFFLYLLLLLPVFSHAGEKKEGKSEAERKKAEQKFVMNDSWHYLASSEQDSSFFTKGVVMRDKDIYDFWLKIEVAPLAQCQNINAFANPTQLQVCDSLKKTELGMRVSHLIMSCSKKKYKTLEAVEYAFNGDVTGRDDKGTDWSTIFPDSVMEKFYSKMCLE